MSHRFAPGGGPCIWCRATREKVADRRAPPFCADRPEHVREREYDDARSSANQATGY